MEEENDEELPPSIHGSPMDEESHPLQNEPDNLQINENSNQSEATSTISADADQQYVNLQVPGDDDEQDEAKAVQQHEVSEINEDEATLCPICLDNWTNTGDHRICALKCGHLFGHSCVLRWITQQRVKNCPTCKKRVCRKDIRFLYTRRLIAVDTSELEDVKQQLKLAIEEKNKLAVKLVMSDSKQSTLSAQVKMLQEEIVKLTQKINKNTPIGNIGYDQPLPKRQAMIHIYKDKSLEICKRSGCRALDACASQDILMASMQSPNNLFAGFGLRKIMISAYKPLSFIPIHSQQIRDIQFHPSQGILLTASTDKSSKVLDYNNDTVIHTIRHRVPLWSCCWSKEDNHRLFLGGVDGSALSYDMRYLNEPLAVLSVPENISPVVSLAYIPRLTPNMYSGGLLCCNLNSLWFFDNLNQERGIPVPSEGPFLSMRFQDETKQVLLSSRPTTQHPSRHTVCTLEKVEDRVVSNVLYSFQGSQTQKMLTKSCFVRTDGNRYFVAAHQEHNKSIGLWSINSGLKESSVPIHDSVLDMCGINLPNQSIFAAVTEKRLDFFKFS